MDDYFTYLANTTDHRTKPWGVEFCYRNAIKGDVPTQGIVKSEQQRRYGALTGTTSPNNSYNWPYGTQYNQSI